MDLIKTRHYLHQNPELSDAEFKTAEFIALRLEQLGVPKIYRNFAGTAVLAEINFNQPGKTVLFRAELDALPIEERNQNLSYRSKNKGVAHKCGHDGHMTILLGFAERLLKKNDFSGKVLLLFQPSEENGKGAKAVLESKILKDFKIDFVFALHNVPGFPLGSVVCKSGNFTPSVESLEIRLTGKTSHAGMPEQGINPARSIAGIIEFFHSLNQIDQDRQDYFLATPIHVKMGEKSYGTSAGEANIGYTFRAGNHSFFTEQKAKLKKMAISIIQKTPGLKAEFIWKESFAANENDSDAVEFIRHAARENKLEYIAKNHPFNWGEDFGLFTQNYKGAMFGLGAGENHPELHHPDYDFPDELIETGIKMFYTIFKQIA